MPTSAATVLVAELEDLRQQQRRDAAAALAALPSHNIPLADANRHIYRWSDSYTRMPMILRLAFYERMDYADWLALLGEHWSSCDNIRDHVRDLRHLLGTAGPLTPMMEPEEMAAYAALPDTVTIYRGCSARHLTGVSWSLDSEVARKFPGYMRYWVPDPVLVTATVRKQHIIALKLDRKESEVITFKAKREEVTSVCSRLQ